MSREDSRVVAMLGSGGMARTYLAAFCNERDIRKVRVFSPTKDHRESYASQMRDMLNIEVEPVGDAESAVRGADIVSTCTDTMTPVLKGQWLRPGMHVTNLGGYELDDEVFQRATAIVRQGVGGAKLNEDNPRIQYGRGHSPVAYVAGNDREMARLPKPGHQLGRMGVAERYPTFTDLVAGKGGTRQSVDDITLYLNGGNQGLQFAAVGSVVYQKAREAGLGRELPTQWFLQDIRD